MSTTLYIDANRTLSSKKADDNNNNEWTYKLAQPIQLPPGSEIALQDTFINRKGITGQTIEIDEDIEEEIYYTYYLSDNPHFAPGGFYQKNYCDGHTKTLERTFCPLGTLFNQNIDQLDYGSQQYQAHRGQVIKIGEPVPNQRLGMMRINHTDGDADKGKTFYNYEGGAALFDPFKYGFTEKPMFACFTSSEFNAAKNDVLEAYDGACDSEDKFLVPLVGHTTIFVPKGVYSVNEIADLIEGQINGKYTDIKKGDRYNDIITSTENDGDYDGSLGTNNTGIYRKAKAFNLYGDGFNRATIPGPGTISCGPVVNNPYAESPIQSAFNQITHYDITPPNQTNIKPPYNPDAVPAQSDGTPSTYRFNSFPSEELIMYLPTHKFNQLCDFWKYTEEYCNFKRAGEDAFNGNITRYNSSDYFSNVFRYGVQHWIGSGMNTGLFYKPKYASTDETDTTNHQRVFTTHPIPNFNDNTEGVNYMPIGLHYKRKIHNYPFIQGSDSHSTVYSPGVTWINTSGDTRPGTGDILVASDTTTMNLDPMKDGYYLGTPDFTFTYDGDKSAFAIGNLHQNCRIPNLDQFGNSFDGSGQGCAYTRRLPAKAEYNLQFQGGNTDEKFRSKAQIKSALQAPQQRVGGIAVYNWAYQTCLKYGDVPIDDKIFNPVQNRTSFKFRENLVSGVPSSLEGRRLNTFSEFFSSKEKAKKAWNKSLWAKLGFTFENLQDETKWEVNKYYDIPSRSTDVDATDVWNSLGHIEKDFVAYGRTTAADLNPSSAPTVSTTSGNKMYKAYDPVNNKEGTDLQVQRTYDNHDVTHPYNGYNSHAFIQGTVQPGTGDFNPSTNASTVDMFVNSFYNHSAMTPIITTGKELVASKLPQLSKDGYYIVTSDIVDNFSDNIKQGMPLPLLGIVPISNLSNQDFLTNKNTLVHTVSQPKVINQVKITILKPDLTAPQLEENSSVLLQITMPLPPSNPQQPDITDDEGAQDKHAHPAKEEDPRA